MRMSEESLHDKDKRTAEGRPQLEHRHFAVVASVIAQMMPLKLRKTTAMHFAEHFKERNVRFDSARFLRACNYDR